MRAGVEFPLQVKLLGPIQIRRDDIDLPLRSTRLQCVVGVLATRLGAAVSRAELVDAIWGDQPPASAENAAHVHIARLRRLLEPDRGPRAPGRLLVWTGSGYLLRLRPDQLDVREFDAQRDHARLAYAAGDLEGALRRYDLALALWHGTPWSRVPGPFAEAERTRLIEHRLTMLEARAEIMLRLGRHTELAAELPPLIDSYPLREQFRALLMRALYKNGRQAEALQVFRETRSVMVEELGIEPGPELRQTHEAILRSDPSLLPTREAALATPPSAGGTEHTAANTVPRQLPGSLRPFVGRAAELAQLTRLLEEAETARARTTGTAPIVVIGGPAGIGKTTLALHWAHQVTTRFPDGQLFLNLRGFDPSDTPTRPAAAIRRFLDALGVPAHRIEADLDAQIALYRSLLAGRRMLIVLDNARDSEQVRPLLPGTPGCLTVITSRDQLTGLVAIEGARPLTLDLPSTKEARDLLVGRLGADRAAAEPAAVDEIVSRCAQLPLALAIAAARAILRPRLRLVDIADELTGSRHQLDALDTGDTIADIRTVFSWSYRALNPPAARLFRLLGLHPGPDVSVPAAASLAGEPVAQTRPLLSELARAHLIVEPAPGRYALHDLLRAYATEQAHTTDTDDHRQAAIGRMLDHYLHTAYAADRLLNPTRDPITLHPPALAVTAEDLADHEQAIDWFTTEHPVLLAVVDRAAATTGHDRQTWQLAWAISRFLAQQGRWHDRVAIGRAAVAAARRLGDPTAEARARDNLAVAYIELGHYQDADAHLRDALTLLGQAGNQTWQANMHMSLGRLRERLGNHAEAIEHARHALELYRAAGHRIGQGNALTAIGWCQAWLGDYRSALIACRQALTRFQELGIRHAEADAWDSLGYVHHGLGHYSEAITCYRNALDRTRERGYRNEEAATLSRLGDTHHAAGDHRSAQLAWQQALVILRDLNHPDTERVRAKLRDPR